MICLRCCVTSPGINLGEFQKLFKRWAGDMAEWLRALDVLIEDLGSIPSQTHDGLQLLITHVVGELMPPLACTSSACTRYIDSQVGRTQTHK